MEDGSKVEGVEAGLEVEGDKVMGRALGGSEMRLSAEVLRNFGEGGRRRKTMGEMRRALLKAMKTWRFTKIVITEC